MTPDRRQHIVRQPNGALVDEAAMRSWIAQMDVPTRDEVREAIEWMDPLLGTADPYTEAEMRLMWGDR